MRMTLRTVPLPALKPIHSLKLSILISTVLAELSAREIAVYFKEDATIPLCFTGQFPHHGVQT